MNEFLEQFLIESRELVEQGTDDLLALEQAPENRDRLDSAFRAFHTLKGAAGIVDFPAMGRVLHAAENVLSAVRAGDSAVTTDLISDSLSCLDQVVQWLDVIEASGDVPEVASAVVEDFVARFDRSAAPGNVLTPTETVVQTQNWLADLLADYPPGEAQPTIALRYAPDAGCFFRGEDPLGLVAQLPELLWVKLSSDQPWPLLDDLDPFSCGLVVTALTAGAMDEALEALRTVSDQVEFQPLISGERSDDQRLSAQAVTVLEYQLLLLEDAEPDGRVGRMASAVRVATSILGQASRVEDARALKAAADEGRSVAAALRDLLRPPAPVPAPLAPDTSAPAEFAARGLRVDVERIDALVKLTDELTVVKNAVGHASRLAQGGIDPESLALTLKAQHAQLDRLIGQLQRSVLGVRVLPVRNIFQRFPKVVREVAASLGKSVRLVTEGDTTEADKAVVEALFEPLLHVVRNALDHGIEPADQRRAAGKSEIATVKLRAAREGDHVVVEVNDDGRGIDLTRIRQVAGLKGLAKVEDLASMADADVIDLIFAPGFSTATTVTDVSGRGVGMDAVRSAIGRLNGRVSVATRPGEGSSVTFVLPFTLMMSRVMTVDAGGQVLGIPFEAVAETVRLPRVQINDVGAAKAFVLRDRTVPVIDLARILELASPVGSPSSEANLLVVDISGQLVALEVDRFGESLDVMLKPIDGLLAGMGGIAGTTLLGDGRDLQVLDVHGLLQ